jgi:hypothetical protein
MLSKAARKEKKFALYEEETCDRKHSSKRNNMDAQSFASTAIHAGNGEKFSRKRTVVSERKDEDISNCYCLGLRFLKTKRILRRTNQNSNDKCLK